MARDGKASPGEARQGTTDRGAAVAGARRLRRGRCEGILNTTHRKAHHTCLISGDITDAGCEHKIKGATDAGCAHSSRPHPPSPPRTVSWETRNDPHHTTSLHTTQSPSYHTKPKQHQHLITHRPHQHYDIPTSHTAPHTYRAGPLRPS